MLIPGDGQVVPNFRAAGDDEAGAGQAEALGRVLELLRDYLNLMARREPGPDRAAKVGASDRVQETFLAAGRDLAPGWGHSPAEWRGGLEGILQHLLSNTHRRYREAAKRRVDREVPGGRGGDAAHDDTDPVATVSLSTTAPSGTALRHVREKALGAALRDLPERDRQVIQWHHQERQSFEAIAGRLGIAPEAARKVWGRALLRLRAALGPGHDPR